MKFNTLPTSTPSPQPAPSMTNQTPKPPTQAKVLDFQPKAAAEESVSPGSNSAGPAHVRQLIAGIEGAQAQVEAEAAAEIAATAEPGDGAPALQTPVTSEGFITPAVFQDGLAKSLSVTGHLVQLETLVMAGQVETFPDASAAIYDTIREWPALHFLIQPGGKWFQRAMAVGVWVGPVALSCSMELKAKKAEARKKRAQAANVPLGDQAPAQPARPDFEAAPANENEPETVNLTLDPVGA